MPSQISSARAAFVLLLTLTSLLWSITPLSAQWAAEDDMFVERWVPSGGARYTGLQFTDPLSGFVIGAVRAANVSRVNHGLLRTADGGQSWTAASPIYPDNAPGMVFDLSTVAARSATDVWAMGLYNTAPGSVSQVHLAQSTDGGNSWQTRRLFEGHIYNFQLARPSAQVAVLVGSDVVAGELFVYRTADAGATWTEAFRHSVTTEFFLEGIAQVMFLSENVGLAAPRSYYFHSTGLPFVYRTTNAGASWVKVPLENNPISDRFGNFEVFQLATTASGQLYALTSNGLYVSSTQGADWQRVSGLPAGVQPELYEQLIVTGPSRLELLRSEPSSRQLAVTSLTRMGTSWQASTATYAIPDQHGEPLRGQAASTGPDAGVSLFSRSLFRSPNGTTQLEPGAGAGPARLRVYPNPATHHSTIEAETFATAAAQLEIMNSAGQRVQQYTIVGGSALKQSIDVSQLPAGLYLLRLTQNGRSTTERLVVQR